MKKSATAKALPGMPLSIRMGWAGEPMTRAGEKFEELWKFLEGLNMADWDRIHGLASGFHPDYMFNQSTRVLDQDRTVQALGFYSMEQGKYSPALLKAFAPTLFQRLPRRLRGVPLEYKEMIMVVAACLACHEYERIDAAIEEARGDEALLARHLYWFERFAALRDRVRAARPPNLQIQAKAAKRTTAWQEELGRFRLQYLKRHAGATMRATVIAFGKKEKETKTIGEDRAYRWALKNLK